MTLRSLEFGSLCLLVATCACTASVDEGGPSAAGGAQGGGGAPSGGAAAGAGGVAVPSGTASKLKFDGMPAYYRVSRLTNEQWTNSVQNVLQLTAPPTNAEGFQEAVAGVTDFTNNELGLSIDSRGASDYRAAAEALAAQVAADPAQLGRLYAGNDGAGFIAAVGRRLYRRPLSATETASYQNPTSPPNHGRGVRL